MWGAFFVRVFDCLFVPFFSFACLYIVLFVLFVYLLFC